MFKPDRKLLRKYCEAVSRGEKINQSIANIKNTGLSIRYVISNDIRWHGSDELFYHPERNTYQQIIAERILKKG